MLTTCCRQSRAQRHRREKRGRSSIADAENRERRTNPITALRNQYKVRKWDVVYLQQPKVGVIQVPLAGLTDET